MRPPLKMKKTQSGLTMLNLGCGARTHAEWNNTDFSPYALLAHHRWLSRFLNVVGILSQFRYHNLLRIDSEVFYWDVRKGLPCENDTCDVVYHSHFITHLDRDKAIGVTRECYRVLKRGGIVRVVVPDLLTIVKAYNEAVDGMEDGDPEARHRHQRAVDDLFELMVRKDPVGTVKQNRFVRTAERVMRGDTAKTGELRRWHYDKYSMAAMLSIAGFTDVRVMGPQASQIRDWNRFGLDVNPDGSIYKPGSLYMEGMK